MSWKKLRLKEIKKRRQRDLRGAVPVYKGAAFLLHKKFCWILYVTNIQENNKIRKNEKNKENKRL